MENKTALTTTTHAANQRIKKHRPLLADGALLLVALIWGGGFVAGKATLIDFPPLIVMSTRFIFSAIILGILFFPRVKAANKSTIKNGIIVGLMQYISFLFQLVGLQHTTPGKQAFLVASYVVMVPFISWIFAKKRPEIKAFLAGIITLIGLACISLNETLTLGKGEWFSLGFAVVFACQIVFIGIHAKKDDILALTFFQFAVAGVLSVITAVITGQEVHGYTLASAGSLLYLILINTVFAFTLQNAVQKYTTDTHVSILLSLESVFGLFFSVLLYQESVTIKMILGCLLVFSAVILSKVQLRLKNKSNLVINSKSLKVSPLLGPAASQRAGHTDHSSPQNTAGQPAQTKA